MARRGPELVCHVGPITSLMICAEKIFWGCGSEVSMFDLDTNKLLARQQILHGASVHGISMGPVDENRHLLCVYGAKQARVISFHDHDKTSDIMFLSDVTEFNDWIWDVHWITDQPGSIAVALAHNIVIRWNWHAGKTSEQRECSEKCILYCARFIGSKWENLILAAGTVFNQVVLWPVACSPQETDAPIDVIHMLSGHQGVIFSIRYNADLQRLCSVSDDRSIRMWQLTFPSRKLSEPDSQDWRSVKSDLLHVLYGHSARIWDVAFTSTYFASVGEDATCCIWNHNGKIMHKFKGHKGRSIWALAVSDDEKFVLTGGGDGSIRMWRVEQENTKRTIQRIISVPQNDVSTQGDFPRTVKMLNFDLIIIMMNSGNLYSYSVNDQELGLIISDSRFRSYSIVSPCPDQVTVALGSIDGVIQVIQLPGLQDEEIRYTERCLFSGKVLELAWLDRFHLVASGPGGLCLLLKVEGTRDTEIEDAALCITTLYQLVLPLCKHRWITSACFIPASDEQCRTLQSLIICGDKDGSLYCYSLMEENTACAGAPLQPSKSFPRVHGKAGVTSVCYRDGSLYTTGRDGHYRQWEIKGGNLTQLHGSRIAKGFDWIDRLEWYNGDILVYGFVSSQFMVWSVSFNQQLMSAHCGGGHRSWGCCRDNDMLRFVYLKNGKVCLVDSGYQTKQIILQTALHGRELCDVKFIRVLSDEKEESSAHLVCTASEDTTISIGIFVNEGKFTCWKPVKLLKGHLSSVRTLALSSLSGRECRSNEKAPVCQLYSKSSVGTSSGKNRDGFLLFSGGGRAEIQAWRLNIVQDFQDSVDEILKDLSHSKNHSTCDRVPDLNHINPCEDCGLNDSREVDSLSVSDVCNDALSNNPSHRATESSTSLDISNFGSLNQIQCSYQHLITYFIRETAHSRFHRKSQKLKLDPETRIMSLDATPLVDLWNEHLDEVSNKNEVLTTRDMNLLSNVHIVSCAGSDGVLRVLTFDEESRTFSHLADSAYHRGCVLKVLHYVHYFNKHAPRHSSFVVSASTNGEVIFWSLDLMVTKLVSDTWLRIHSKLFTVLNNKEPSEQGESMRCSDEENDDCVEASELNIREERAWVPVACFKAHQSGINSLHILQVSESNLLLASGGDDNAVTVHLLQVSEAGVKTLTKTTKEDAHAAQVTGIHLCSSSILVSGSIDQRICVWRIEQATESQIELHMVACRYISVADVSSMAVYLHKNSVYIAVAGEGLCLYKLNSGDEDGDHHLTQASFTEKEYVTYEF